MVKVTDKVKVSHIFVKKYSEAEQILEKLKHGADFNNLAKTHSLCTTRKNGGKLPEFSKGRMIKEFEDVAFKLNKGEISGVVKTKIGYHIIKREE
ncbi:MAG: peptidyl-prolyl cis-trans isomerase [Candidatus Heimdallarchaeum aukensis]|uniref:peptidylprolyl isomerase n=1 Tax=Candidatus Heimdallarchaeum aukensis TaxID=2876573 RepID=A0A9Y1FMQ8_9ARCH|nr:MAG: peptidyl-prolyl cis-trans isomerase [Candidatus Heimdallarchaeum aukensis]